MDGLSLDFATTDAQLAEVPRTPAFKECRVCGATYSLRRWLKLPYKGAQLVEGYPEETLSLRDCSCGSTLAVRLSDEATSHGLAGVAS